jgi:hypothetical protein
MLQMV